MKPGELMSRLRSHFGRCVSKSCRKGRCSLGVAAFRPGGLVIVDCDKYKEHYGFEDRLCDYIVFCGGEGLETAVVEMKGGSVGAGAAIEQIRNGSLLAEQMAHDCPHAGFYPILLKGKRISPSEIKTLRRGKVPFRGRPYLVILERCGIQLRSIMSKQPTPPG